MARRMDICLSQGRAVVITWLSKGAVAGIIDLHEGNFIPHYFFSGVCVGMYISVSVCIYS